MSLNLLSAMSANTEKYDPRNHLGYRKFRNRGYGGGGGGHKPGGTPWSDPDALHMMQHGVGPWDREEDKQKAYERHQAYVEQQHKTRDDPKPKTKSDVAGQSKVEINNNSFQSDVSSVCVNYVL